MSIWWQIYFAIMTVGVVILYVMIALMFLFIRRNGPPAALRGVKRWVEAGIDRLWR